MARFSAFRSRVERNIVLMVLICGVLPLAIVAIVAMQEIERQTLNLAEQQLLESTRTYADDLLDQIRLAETEVRLLYLSNARVTDAHSIGGFSVVVPQQPISRTVLVEGDKSLLVQVPQDNVVLIGTVAFDKLFDGLDRVPYGVRRCVLMNGKVVGCHGPDVTPDTEVVDARWELPLTHTYATAIELSVTSSQLRVVALRHVSLVAKILPVAILTIALVIGWFLILQIRRRMSPLSELQEATWAVRKGDYAYQVSLNTGDEFERLGRAFNLMTARLGSSFRSMKALAEIDRLILSGAEVKEVTRRGLKLAEENCLAPCFAYFWETTPSSGQIFQLLEDDLMVKTVKISPSSELDVRAVPTELGNCLERRVCASFEILRDGEPCGYLFAVGNSGLSTLESSTLSELADRMSVAATNVDRAQALYRQANYDGLTGLINRHAFSERLKEHIELARRRGGRGALLFLDLDRFKHVNDTEGHVIGDELLRVVAKRLLTALRGTDVVARLGGDEFAVIFPDFASPEELNHLCERLISAVSQPITVDRISHSVDVSVGVSVFPSDGVDSGALLMKADVAMYKAKEHKGSAFALFDKSLNEATEQRVRIETRLREALSRNELELYFQPKMNLKNGYIEQVEGLLRWPRGEWRNLAPDQFIPVAEETGMIHQLTEVLVEQSARCLEMSAAQNLGLQRVAINISSLQFSREGFSDRLLAALTHASLNTTQVELEITESLFVDNVERVIDELRKLRTAGVHIALDDFGTGYSSLNMLRSLPLDTLKIDRSFITPLESSTEARDVAQKIVEIARTLNLQVVAEGVQTWSEAKLLKKLGCDYVQGFVVSEALPLDRLGTFLTERLASVRERKVVALRQK